MAWTTVTLAGHVREGGRVHLTLVYGTDDAVPQQVQDEIYIDAAPSPTYLKSLYLARLAALNALATFDTGLTVGALDTTPVTVPPPTQTDLDKAAFVQDYGRWIAIKRGIDAGIINAALTAVVNFQAQVKTEFNTVVTDVGIAEALKLL